MTLTEQLLNLTKQLYPTGRTWKMAAGSNLESLHVALNSGKEQFWNDALGLLDSILPDNDNFTIDDATDWEVRLGMPVSNATLAQRKAAILRKLQYPGKNPAKGHYLYIQEQLQLAGFNLYVFENRFYFGGGQYFTENPLYFYNGGVSTTQHGTPTPQHGSIQHGWYFNNKVAMHIKEEDDYYFDIGQNFRSTFFVGGNPIGTWGSVPLVRKNELRELILKLKPLQTIGFLFVNYT